MKNFLEYLSAVWPFTPLFLFILAISFRLLDNSAYLFLKNDILINSSNVSRKVLKDQIRDSEDPDFTKQLKRALLFRNLQQSFLILAGVSLLIISALYFLS